MPGWTPQHPLPNPSVLAHVVDVHCHPTDSALSPTAFSKLPHRICAMATRGSDQALVRSLAEDYPSKVIPCFGYHPWFTHWISLEPASSKEDHYRSLFFPGPDPSPENVSAFDRILPNLPEPTPLSSVLADLRRNLLAHPNAMLGEVGLDRACRVPYALPAEPPYADHVHEEGAELGQKGLSPFTIPLAHQVTILEAQLELAIDLKRNVSVHSVKAQAATVELLGRMKRKHGKQWDDISIDMHSCGLSAQTWKDLEKQHCNVFLSLSTAINSRSPAHITLLQAVSPTRLLVESDFHDIELSAPFTWDMLCRAAEAKGWWVEVNGEEVEQGRTSQMSGEPKADWGAVRRIAENWKAFERGGNKLQQKKRDKRRLVYDESEEEDL